LEDFCLKDFCVYVYQRNWPVVFFYGCPVFGVRVILASQNKFGSISFLFHFMK
jgi:hypothetical protein